MELRHLRYFVAAAEEENVSRAALKLHVSQPGVSRQIRDLEEEIGVQLFERSAKSLRLTDAGKTFLSEARAVLLRADDAVKKAQMVVSGARGEIHVGYAPSLTVQILPPTLREFQRRFPKVRVALHDLSTEEMVTQLCSGKLHVALMVKSGRKMLRGLESAELARYALRVAVAPSHPLAKSKTVRLAQIAREPLIAYRRADYPEYHAMLEKLFATLPRAVRTPRIVEEYDGVSEIVLAVESGNGFAFLPECVSCMVGQRLKLIPLAEAAQPIPVIAAWKKETLTAAVQSFIAVAQTVSANATPRSVTKSARAKTIRR